METNSLIRLNTQMLEEPFLFEMSCTWAFQDRSSILSPRDLLSCLVYLNAIYIIVYCVVI